jgi:hypothetical protein
MGNLGEGDKAPDPEPWANDERLKDFLKMDTIIRTVRLIQKLAESMEKTPIGVILKTESIPMLWEKVKDLKPESILDLQKTLLEHGAYRQSEQKDKEENLEREKFARQMTEVDKKARDKRPLRKKSTWTTRSNLHLPRNGSVFRSA